MINDTARLMNDVRTIVSTISPNMDEVKLTHRLEEIVHNYNVHRKSNDDLENDLQEKIEMYINARRIEGYSKLTLDGYRIELGMFGRFVDKSIVLVTTSDIRRYLASNDKWKASTVDGKLARIKAFFTWLVDEELLLKNPANKIRPPKQPKRLPESLTIKELETVRESCGDLRSKSILEFFYATACRVSEMAIMKISDVDFQGMSVTYIAKGNKEHTAYLSERSVYHLRKYLDSRNDDSEYLFVRRRRPFTHMSSRNLERIISKVKLNSGIDSNLTPHTLRRTKSQLMLSAGSKIEDVSALLGHSNVSTTLKSYAYITEDRKREAHQRYHVQ